MRDEHGEGGGLASHRVENLVRQVQGWAEGGCRVEGVQSGQVPRAKGPTTVASGRNTAVAATVSQPPSNRWRLRAITSKSVTAAATQSSQLRSVAGKAAHD